MTPADPMIPQDAQPPGPGGAYDPNALADSLSQSDLALVRVIEDLIDTLIEKGLIQFTDLPSAAQAKLLSRRETRAALKDPLRLLPADDADIGLDTAPPGA